MSPTSDVPPVLTIREIPSPRCWRLSDPTALHGFSLEMQLTDHGPGQGTLTVRHDGDSWTHYWSAMGSETTIAQFLAGSDCHYVAHKLKPGIDDLIIDWDAVRELIKRKLLERESTNGDPYSKDRDDLGDDLYRLSRLDDHDLSGQSGYELLCRAFRSSDIECWELPRIPNPEYLLLERLVSMCIAACKELARC